MKSKKITIFFIIFTFFIFITSFFNTVFAKYIIEQQAIVAKLNIDRCPPQIQLIKIENSNTLHPNYASKKHSVVLTFKVIEKNIKAYNINYANTEITLDGKIVHPRVVRFSHKKQVGDEKIFLLTLNEISGNGLLKIHFPEGVVQDIADLKTEDLVFDTNITIDNIAPTTIFKETVTKDGKSLAEIKCNEPVNQLDGWNYSSEDFVLSKEFEENSSFPITITDLAGNEATITINIKNAKFQT